MQQSDPPQINGYLSLRDVILGELLDSLPVGFHKELLEAYIKSPSQQTIEDFLKRFRLNLPEE